MIAPIITGITFSILMIGLSFKKPNTARIVLGVFFLIMGIGVNGAFTLLNPQLYVSYGQTALLPFYQILTLKIIALNPVIFGLLLIIYEITIGLLMLHNGKFVKFGLIGAILFIIAITPVSIIQLPWLGLIATPAYLLTKDFDATFWHILYSRFAS